MSIPATTSAPVAAPPPKARRIPTWVLIAALPGVLLFLAILDPVSYRAPAVGREYADQFVRATVTLATVLLLIAISQRFKTRRVRVGLLLIAAVLLCFPVYNILILPRA